MLPFFCLTLSCAWASCWREGGWRLANGACVNQCRQPSLTPMSRATDAPAAQTIFDVALCSLVTHTEQTGTRNRNSPVGGMRGPPAVEEPVLMKFFNAHTTLHRATDGATKIKANNLPVLYSMS